LQIELLEVRKNAAAADASQRVAERCEKFPDPHSVARPLIRVASGRENLLKLLLLLPGILRDGNNAFSKQPNVKRP
jgi:hypothetical protein